jgi:hypothetical protein
VEGDGETLECLGPFHGDDGVWAGYVVGGAEALVELRIMERRLNFLNDLVSLLCLPGLWCGGCGVNSRE